MTDEERPNILWLMSEDCSPHGAAYGDPLAETPTLDRLAREGVVFENAYCTVPVCAPSRFGLITGMYAASCGPAEHMAATAHLPSSVLTYPEVLRAVGFYCTNNEKTHYNCDLDPDRIWDESSSRAHWRDRPVGAPFLAVFNPMYTHESALFREQPTHVRPGDVRVPAYLPDLPEIRTDLASYYTAIARMDDYFGERISELEEDGLLENTIIVYSSDHGGVGPRSKRFCYDEGLRVPLIVRVPARWQHLSRWRPGQRVSAAISQIDIPATLVALGGLQPPPTMAGRPLLGTDAPALTGMAFSGRDRMDEHDDMTRTLRDERYRYIRNYAPHRPYGQHYAFAWNAAGYQAWEREHLTGTLTADQDRFWEPKPAEEFYDTLEDPDEVRNLIDSSRHRDRIERFRRLLDENMIRINDNGFIPEGSPLEGYESSRRSGVYPLRDLLSLSSHAIARDPTNLPEFETALADENEVIRFWAAQGLLILAHHDPDAVVPSLRHLQQALDDASGAIRVAAAEALAIIGGDDVRGRALDALVSALRADAATLQLPALNALIALGAAAHPALPTIELLADSDHEYVRGAARYLRSTLTGEYTPQTPVFDWDRFLTQNAAR